MYKILGCYTSHVEDAWKNLLATNKLLPLKLEKVKKIWK